MKQSITLTDLEFAGFRSGNISILNKIYSGYSLQLYTYAYKKCSHTQDAEDIVAQALVMLWSNRDTMKNPEHITNFLYRVTSNLCSDLLRKKTRQPGLDLSADLHDIAAEEYDHEKYEWLEAALLASVKQIEDLPHQQRQIMVYNFIRSFSVNKIARLLKIDIKTVYAQRTRAIQKIRKITRGI